MSEEFIPTLTHATERDIDLILVEELYASPAFVSWLAGRAGLAVSFDASTVLHSKRRTRSRREIDIFVELSRSMRPCGALLVENKLDATEQPDQAESYREEIDRLRPTYAASAMVIVCPEAYQAQYRTFTAKFDAVVTYEELAAYFAAEEKRVPAPWSGRAQFRKAVIEQAIGKHRRGYTPVLNEVVGDFNARYVALLAKTAPRILPGPSMLKPANPDESTSMIFDHEASLPAIPPDLRPRRFAHELGRGKEHRANYVAVTFAGWGHALDSLKGVFEADTAELGAQFFAKPPTKVRPNPGLVMACATDPVDNQGDFSAQKETIIAGIRRAQQLKAWLEANVAILRGWRTLIEHRRAGHAS